MPTAGEGTKRVDKITCLLAVTRSSLQLCLFATRPIQNLPRIVWREWGSRNSARLLLPCHLQLWQGCLYSETHCATNKSAAFKSLLITSLHFIAMVYFVHCSDSVGVGAATLQLENVKPPLKMQIKQKVRLLFFSLCSCLPSPNSLQ